MPVSTRVIWMMDSALQAGHTVRGARPLAFRSRGVRCVVGTDHVDDAVSNSLTQRHDASSVRSGGFTWKIGS